MSADENESLHLYHYLCQKFGSERAVKGRRLTFMANDTAYNGNAIGYKQVSSGSKSEGLDLKSSDIDMMYIDPNFTVYESEKEAVLGGKAVLIMETNDTQPGFTHLRLYTNYSKLENKFKQSLEQHGMKYLLSSNLYKQFKIQDLKSPCKYIIHGPCLSDIDGSYDWAHCIKCDKWISQAVPWIIRPRSSWLSSEIISKIIMTGVLFVPIGLKGSINEHLGWRTSFSVAEKIIVFSFNHTQLLCYALLKVILKEIIMKDEELKGLLCSYYIKTLLFWISDEMDTFFWRTNNIISCFESCLQRLLYSVEYSILLHYFIPEVNLFHFLSTDLKKKIKLTNLLTKLYQQGIKCFSYSELLHDYNRSFTEIDKKDNIKTVLVRDILQITCACINPFNEGSVPILLHRLLHYCKTDLCNTIFLHYMAGAHQCVPQHSYTKHLQNKKQQYCRYKRNLSQLLIGLNSDAVVGWLMLASFFFVHENYQTSLDLINYALSKYTDEKSLIPLTDILSCRVKFTQKQLFMLKSMKKEKLFAILKAFAIYFPCFDLKSNIIPEELKLDVTKTGNIFHPFTYAHFLRFLCFYYLHDRISCKLAIHHLNQAYHEIYHTQEKSRSLIPQSSTCICVGIAQQMMGNTNYAKKLFKTIAERDPFDDTSAGTRLCLLDMYTQVYTRKP